MLNAIEIDSLPAGTFPNSYLRSKFGKKHGHVVQARTMATKTRDPEDVSFIGNRSQWKYRRRNPLGKIKLRYNSKFQKNRFENQERSDLFSKILKAFAKLFKFLFFKS